MKKYLTVQEFVDTAATASNITIYTKKFVDGKKRHRCDCMSPVEDLQYDGKRLSWSDSNGDPHFWDAPPNEIMKDITDDGEYFTSCYIDLEEEKDKPIKYSEKIPALERAIAEGEAHIASAPTPKTEEERLALEEGIKELKEIVELAKQELAMMKSSLAFMQSMGADDIEIK